MYIGQFVLSSSCLNLNLTNVSDTLIYFTLFQKYSSVNTNSASILATATSPVINTSIVNTSSVNTTNNIIVNTSIRIDVLSTGLPPVISSVLVDNKFVVLHPLILFVVQLLATTILSFSMVQNNKLTPFLSMMDWVDPNLQLLFAIRGLCSLCTQINKHVILLVTYQSLEIDYMVVMAPITVNSILSSPKHTILINIHNTNQVSILIPVIPQNKKYYIVNT